MGHRQGSGVLVVIYLSILLVILTFPFDNKFWKHVFSLFFFFGPFRAAPSAYGGSQAKGGSEL